MQAQEPKPPYVGLWTRIADFDRQQLSTALWERDAIRATAMRGTLHLMSATDYAAFRATLQPVLTQATSALRGRDEGLELDRVLPVARELLDERPRDFNELRALLAERFPGVNDRALGYATRMNLALAMVPTDDRWGFPARATFTPAESWLRSPLAADADPKGLVRRYLAAFGPASAADAQTWSGLQLAGAFAELRPELRVFVDERGRELLDLPDAPRPDGDVEAPPRFLPEFDNLVLSHANRTRVLADEHRSAVATKNLRIRSTFLLDGFVRGIWKVERKRTAATLRISPFSKLPARVGKRLADEGERLLSFVEPDATTLDVAFDEPGIPA